jgi:hypothetical protein
MLPQLTVIGLIHSPFKSPAGTPIQPALAGGTEGTSQTIASHRVNRDRPVRRVESVQGPPDTTRDHPRPACLFFLAG